MYLDSSVALAELFLEDVRPPETLWDERLISSRLLVYECWVRAHARGLAQTHGEALRALLRGVAKIALIEPIVAGAVDPQPMTTRTLDALHVASMLFLKEQVEDLVLATYDRRLAAAATASGIELYPL